MEKHFITIKDWVGYSFIFKIGGIFLSLAFIFYCFSKDASLSFLSAFLIVTLAHRSLYEWLILERNYVKVLKKMILCIKELPIAICLVDKQGVILWKNARLGEYLTQRDAKNSQSIFPLIEKESFYTALQHPDQKKTLLRLTTEQYLESVIQPLTDSSCYIIYLIDISERIFFENSRRVFFGNISHELRIPLTVLKGYIEILESKRKQSKHDKADLKPYKSMQKQIDRLLGMVEQLLMLAQIEENPFSEEKKIVDMPDIIYSIYDEVQLRKGDKNTITLYLDDELVVEGYENLLRASVSNLIYNAIEHNPKHTEIEICWQRVEKESKPYALFAIRDNGIGISQEHVSRLTERFYMASSACDRSFKRTGSGLGLAIVSNALKKHGSMLLIDSEQGQGSLFQFYLPAYDEKIIS